MTLRLILATLILIAFNNSSAQSPKTNISAIDTFCQKLETDTGIIRWSPKDNPSTLCVCDGVDLYETNDSIVKVTTWSLHTSIGKLEYYYKSDSLVYARLTKTFEKKIKIKEEYYFDKGHLIKILTVPINVYKTKEEKQKAGKSIYSNGQKILNRVNKVKDLQD